MLIKIRDKATGWIAYAIVILISIPFALWGIQQYFGLDTSPIIISVDDQEITEFQLEQAVLNRKRELEQNQANFDIPEDQIKAQVIGEIVTEQLLISAIKKYNLQITNQELADFIRTRPEFQKDQRFDAKTYQDLLASNGFSVTTFEQAQRELLKREQLISMIQESSFVLPSERKHYVYLSEQERKARYMLVGYGYFIEPDSIDIEQARAVYEANPELYQSPHEARFHYLDVRLDNLETLVMIDNEDARIYYDENTDEFVYPEKFNLRHILLSTETRDLDAALMEAGELYQQLEAGADFSELARQYSDDELTAESGGELPELTAQELDNDEVRDAVLQLIEGEFTPPIQTQYGVQIFQLTALAEAKQKSFAEVEEELLKDLKSRQAAKRYDRLMDTLDDYLYKDEIRFFQIVTRNHPRLPQTSTRFLDINKTEDILATPKIREAIISEIIQGDKVNTGLVEVEEGKHYVYVGIIDARSAEQLSFEEAKQDIITYLTLEQAQLNARENNEAWIRELQAGNTNLDDIAKQGQWVVKEHDYIKRTDVSVPYPIMEKIYEVTRPAKFPTYRAFQLDDSYNNDHIIVELIDIKEGIETSQTFVPYSLRNREAIAILDSLQEFHEVDINLEPEEEE